ncbi:hypothetical protein U1Q18_000852 [Sarracenia purpurea var. burkii]
MEATVSSVIISFALVTLLTCAWKVVNWVWLKPKKMERCLREQGFKGNPYKLLYGDTKELISKIRDSGSKPMEPTSDDLVPRLLPFYHHSVNLHGKKYFEWMGPTPRISITDPKLIREILHNYEVFQKSKLNPLGKLLVTGILTYEGEKWAKHRSLLNPAFHLEKLKANDLAGGLSHLILCDVPSTLFERVAKALSSSAPISPGSTKELPCSLTDLTLKIAIVVTMPPKRPANLISKGHPLGQPSLATSLP